MKRTLVFYYMCNLANKVCSIPLMYISSTFRTSPDLFRFFPLRGFSLCVYFNCCRENRSGRWELEVLRGFMVSDTDSYGYPAVLLCLPVNLDSMALFSFSCVSVLATLHLQVHPKLTCRSFLSHPISLEPLSFLISSLFLLSTSFLSHLFSFLYSSDCKTGMARSVARVHNGVMSSK